MLIEQSPKRNGLAARPNLLALLLLFACVPASPAIEFDDRFEQPMFHDPELKLTGFEIVFYDNLRPVWFAALSDDDPELRRLAADTISLAHRKGMPGLDEAETALVALLQREDGDQRIRRAAAKALVAIDARNAAATLAEYLPDADLEYVQVVEPALAGWNYQPMREVWLARVSEPSTGRVRLLLACRCLAIVDEPAARDPLTEIAIDSNALAALRLAAARAASDIDQSNLLEMSASLLGQEKFIDRLVGTTLLRRHTSEPAIALLHQSASDPAPVVAGLALRALFEIDPKLVWEHAPQAVQHRDVKIRRVGAEALVARADVEAVELLSPLLDDPNRSLRRFVSDELVRLAAADELSKTVIAEAGKAVLTDRWRGLEQALMILGSLDHEPSAARMVELLRHPRPEVGVAAAWALRKISVAETLPPMLQYAAENADAVLTGGNAHDGISLQLSQIFQAFGKMGYAESEPLLRKFIPKTAPAQEARCAAIWALGLLHQDKAPQELTELLVGRLKDINPLMPEYEGVRRTSAVSLGRMRSMSALSELRKFSEEANGTSEPAVACAWAIEHLTGEKFPQPEPFKLGEANWFLAPIKLADPVKQVVPGESAKP